MLIVRNHLKPIYSKVNILIKNNKKFYQSSYQYYQVLTPLLAEHNRVCFLIFCSSNKMFSRVLLTFFLTNVPINVYFLKRIIFQKQKIVDLLLYWFIVLLQIGAAFTVLFPLSSMCKIVHLPKKFLFNLQCCLSGRQWLWYKLKIEDLNYTLFHRPKISVGIGFIKAVTFKAVFEVRFNFLQ